MKIFEEKFGPDYGIETTSGGNYYYYECTKVVWCRAFQTIRNEIKRLRSTRKP